MRRQIEKVLHSHEADDKSPLAVALFLLSKVYGAVMRLRALGYRSGRLKTKRLPCKVASVGNITVGGTGKTPMTIHLAEVLHRLGFRPAVISRGYKGDAEKRGGVVSDGRKFFMTVEKAGDEPWMMARRLQQIGVPVVVGRNRFESGVLALRAFQPDVILLDDAYQHLGLWRDLNLILLDSVRPFGNTHLLPRGILREPLSALSRGDIFVLTGTENDELAAVDSLRSVIGSRTLYTASRKPFLSRWVSGALNFSQPPIDATKSVDLWSLRGKRVFGFSGIGGNEGFRKTLESLGCDLAGFAGFEDHYRYSNDDVTSLLGAAAQSGVDVVCTTEKDYVRISRHMPWSVDVAVIGVDLSMGSHQEAFEKDVVSYLVSEPIGSSIGPSGP